jgi:hypothetical protein
MMLPPWRLLQARVIRLCRGDNFVSVTMAIFRRAKTSVCRVSVVKQ